MQSVPSGEQHVEPEDLTHKSSYKVVIKDLEASGLPKPDLYDTALTFSPSIVCKKLRLGLKFTLLETLSALLKRRKVEP